jgi:hypothetical protein
MSRHLDEQRAQKPVTQLALNVRVEVITPGVDAKGVLVREETALAGLNVLGVLGGVHFSDETGLEFRNRIHGGQVEGDPIFLGLGGLFKEAICGDVRIQLHVIRVEFGRVPGQHAGDDGRAGEPVQDLEFVLAEPTFDVYDNFFNKF